MRGHNQHFDYFATELGRFEIYTQLETKRGKYKAKTIDTKVFPMESPDDLTSLRQTLDQVTLEWFSTLDVLYLTRGRLQALMARGFLSLARARYSMGGPSSVGALQFNQHSMEASVAINVAAEEDGHDDCGEGKPCSQVCLSLVEKRASVSKTIDRQKIDDQNRKASGDLRQRKGHSEKAETVGMATGGEERPGEWEGSRGDGTKSDMAMDTPLDCQAASGGQDPLKLFGVLVSPHLRHSQAAFRQSLPLLVDIANLHSKLQGLHREFQGLMAKKGKHVEHREN